MLPSIFLIRDTSSDPVFAGLNRLDLPGWASQQHQDDSAGSPWCVGTCRLRQRVSRSAKSTSETDVVYERALSDAGWQRWRTPNCPSGVGGVYTCWQRDQYVLDLWTRDMPCDLSNLGTGSGPAPSTSPSTLMPGLTEPGPTSSGPPATCGGSLVTVKVANRIDTSWHN